MKKSLARKLSVFFAGIVFITCLVLVGLTVMIFGNIEDRMKDVLYENTLQSYKTEVKSEVQSAISSIEYYYNLSDSGKIDEATAKKDALEALRNLRYGDDDSGYFWVDDTDYNLVMHPILPEQEGTNRYDLTDKNGVKIIFRFGCLAKLSVVFKFQIIRLAETVHLCNNTLFSRTLSRCRLIIVNAV